VALLLSGRRAPGGRRNYSLTPVKGEGAERLEEEEEDGFRASEDDLQLDVMESNEVGEEDEEDRGHS